MANVKLFDKYGNEIDHLTQWDMNVTLKIMDFNYDIAPVCHFAKRYDKEAITVTSTLSDNIVSVVVPNILLSNDNKRADPIKMYVFLYESDEKSGRTIYVVDLPVETKPKPNDYEYEDNVEVVQLSELRVKLESLIAKAEDTIDTKIEELGNTYQNTITEIQTAIRDDVENLNTQITNANTNLIGEIRNNNMQLATEIRDNNAQLTSDIQSAKSHLNTEIKTALNTLLNGIEDGSPKGVFTNPDELTNKPSGIYLMVNSESIDNGYIFYWDGTELSNRLLYYAGVVINNGSVTYEKLAENVKKRFYQFIEYILTAKSWVDGKQIIDISNDYTTTAKTKVDVEIGAVTYSQMLKDDCAAIYVTTNEENDGELLAHCIGNPPTVDIAVQLNIIETY